MRINTQWDAVELNMGTEPAVIITDFRKDIILWEDHYESWNWKAKATLVDTSAKEPLVHSPGITFAALDYAVRGCPRSCHVLIASTGWEGQLPITEEALKKLKACHPNV